MILFYCYCRRLISKESKTPASNAALEINKHCLDSCWGTRKKKEAACSRLDGDVIMLVSQGMIKETLPPVNHV